MEGTRDNWNHSWVDLQIRAQSHFLAAEVASRKHFVFGTLSGALSAFFAGTAAAKVLIAMFPPMEKSWLGYSAYISVQHIAIAFPICMALHSYDAAVGFEKRAVDNFKLGVRYKVLLRHLERTTPLTISSNVWRDLKRDYDGIEGSATAPVLDHIILAAKAAVLNVEHTPPFYYKYVPVWLNRFKCEQECNKAVDEYVKEMR